MSTDNGTLTNGANIFDRLEEQLEQVNARLAHIARALASHEPAFSTSPHSSSNRRDLLTSPVAPDSIVDGFFVAASDLKVAGLVKGDLLCNGTLFVSEEGVVQASVTAFEVIVAGRLEGAVQCWGRLLVLSTGMVSANVDAGTVVLQPGARLAGELRVRDDTARNTPRAASTDSLGELPAPSVNGTPHPASAATTEDAGQRPEEPQVDPPFALGPERLFPRVEVNDATQRSVAYAQSVRTILSERARRSVQRLTRNGKRTGRPRVSDREGFQERFTTVLERLKRGELSHRGAARELSIGHATLLRLLRQRNLS